MQENILRSSNVTKIFIEFSDGKNYKRKESVTVKYVDNKSCYFSGPVPSAHFTKPKWRTKANIIVYTPEGVYKTTVIIRDVDFSLNNVLYRLDLPKKWDFKQLRSGSRKKIKLPLVIVFNDGLTIEAETFDLSVGGFSFVGEHNFSTLHTRFASNCKIVFPKDLIMNFPDQTLEKECIYVRKKAIVDDYEHIGQNLYCFKFLKLSPDETMVLKNFLLKL